MKIKTQMKSAYRYEVYLKKAREKLILKREDEILLELRASREYLEMLIHEGFESINKRLDRLMSETAQGEM